MATQVARDWEAAFSNWKGKASDSEQDRYERTCRAIGDALRASERLGKYEFTVYAKGSYPNFTNVVRDSDVDIAVELTTYRTNRFIHAAEGLTIQDLGLTPYTGDATLAGFKDDVEHALIAYFGAAAVDRGSKAIRVAENTGRLPADVVPCVTERTWTSRTGHNDGIRLLNDRNPTERIVNYPKQHLEQGTRKNDATSRRYKRVVRILKRLENEMVEKGIIEVVPSFLIESSVWNVPNSGFDASSWKGRVRAALAHIYNETRTPDCVTSDDWLEANAIKYLFYTGQNWNYTDAHEFASKAWDYIGFD
jgi:hypothetical protein